MVEGGAPLDAVGEVLARLGVGDVPQLLGDGRQPLALFRNKPVADGVGQPLGGAFGVPPGVDEHERRAVVGQRVPDDGRRGLLVGVDPQLLLGAVAEVHRLPVVDALPELDGPPGGIDQLGVEPLGDVGGVADRRRQRDHLDGRVDAAELRQRHLQRRPPTGVVDEVDLVGDDAVEVVDPRRAVADEGVDLLAGGDDDVFVGEPLARILVVAGGNADGDPVVLEDGKLLALLAGQRPQRDDVQRRAAAIDGRQHRQLRDERLTTCSRHGGDEALAGRHPGFDGGGLRRVQRLDATLAEVIGEPRGDAGGVGDIHYPSVVRRPI